MVSGEVITIFPWASWSSVIAGSITALAISLIMAMLGVALGFTVVDPKSDHPVSGLGKTFGIWSCVSILVSIAAGGFMAGLLSGRLGLEHGFLTWAVVTLMAMCMGASAIGMAVRTIGSAVKGAGSEAMDMASSIGSTAINAASKTVSQLGDNLDIDIDTHKLTEKTRSILRDTGIETLQPEYLSEQVRGARSELRRMLHQLALHPNNYEQLINEFLEKGKARLQAMTGNLDKDTAVQALMKTRNIPQEEAATLVDNAIDAYDSALTKIRETVAEAKQEIRDAKEHIREMSLEAREKADEAASMATKAALGAAGAMILAALVSMGMGYLGSRCYGTWYIITEIQNILPFC